MKNRTSNLIGRFGFKKLFWCFFIIAIILVSIISIFPNNDDVPINNEKITSFNDGWVLQNTGEEITLPYIFKTTANDTVQISKILPNMFEQVNPTLSFHSSLQSVVVMVDDRIIYTYAQEEDAYFDVQPPPAWHIIRLSQDMEGKTLHMTFRSPYASYSGVLNDVELGTKYANVSNFVGSRLFSIALCFIIFTFGLFALVICMFAHNKVADLNQLLYLGVASLLISLWSVCETKAMQIFTGNVQSIMFVTFLSIMLFPIPLLLFFREKFSGAIRKFYNVLIGAFSLYFIIIVLLQLLNIVNFNDYFYVLLILVAISLLFVLFSTFLKYRANKTAENMIPLIAVLALFVFSMIDMYRYFFMDLALTSYSDTAMFGRVGTMFMLYILGYSAVRQILIYYSENSKTEAYKIMAQTDSMSGLKNRAYLSAVCFGDFEIAAKRRNSFAVIMVDIDNFKNYNDHYGHASGDDVILKVAQVLQVETMNLGGTAIRYGGEEFLLVLPGVNVEKAVEHADKIKAGIAAKEIIHEYNSADSFVTVSQGIYSAVPTLEDSLDHFIVCSDKAMYEVKRMNKNGYRVYQPGALTK